MLAALSTLTPDFLRLSSRVVGYAGCEITIGTSQSFGAPCKPVKEIT
jgi:hypothetical protein